MYTKLVIILLLFLPIFFSDCYAGKEYIVKEICFAKAKPKQDSFILFVIEPKEKVTAIEEYNDWLKIQKPDNTKIYGWVKKNKLVECYIETKQDSFLVYPSKDPYQSPQVVRANNFFNLFIFCISFLAIAIIIFLIIQIAKNSNKHIDWKEKPKITDQSGELVIKDEAKKKIVDKNIKIENGITTTVTDKNNSKSDSINKFLKTEVKDLPHYLEDFLFNKLSAVYNPLKEDFVNPRNEEELKGYLGTYFPRSFIETKTIFLELFKLKTMKKILGDRGELRILDVGAGAGGNLMGFLDCLRENGLMNKQIDIISVDGFKLALDYQEKIIIECFLREINSKIKLSFNQEHHRFQSKEHFKFILQNILKENNIKYDIVMTSKFISSLYTIKNGAWDGTYEYFARLTQDFLEKDGFALLLETTNPPKNQTRFMSTIMNSELARLLTPEYSLKHILPLSCAFYHKNCKSTCYTQKIYKLNHKGFNEYKLIQKISKNADLTKVTLKVLAHHEFAKKILMEIKQRNKYIQNWKNDRNQKIYPDSSCQEGVPQNMNGQAPNIADAFSLN